MYSRQEAIVPLGHLIRKKKKSYLMPNLMQLQCVIHMMMLYSYIVINRT